MRPFSTEFSSLSRAGNSFAVRMPASKTQAGFLVCLNQLFREVATFSLYSVKPEPMSMELVFLGSSFDSISDGEILNCERLELSVSITLVSPLPKFIAAVAARIAAPALSPQKTAV